MHQCGCFHQQHQEGQLSYAAVKITAGLADGNGLLLGL